MYTTPLAKVNLKPMMQYQRYTGSSVMGNQWEVAPMSQDEKEEYKARVSRMREEMQRPVLVLKSTPVERAGVPKTEIVKGSEVRAGDRLLREMDKDGTLLGNWGVVAERKNGVLGFMEKAYVFGAKPKFRAFKKVKDFHIRYVQVELPRPEAELNEWGPISP